MEEGVGTDSGYIIHGVAYLSKPAEIKICEVCHILPVAQGATICEKRTCRLIATQRIENRMDAEIRKGSYYEQQNSFENQVLGLLREIRDEVRKNCS